MAKKSSTTRKGVAIGLAVVGIAGLSLASAASLGGITVGSLGAETSVVATCDSTGIGVGWGAPVYDAGKRGYTTNQVVLTLVDAACNGKKLAVTVSDTAGVSLATAATAAIVLTGSPASTVSSPLSVTVDSKLIANVAVVISD